MKKSKRAIKNCIMILMIVALAMGSYFTLSSTAQNSGMPGGTSMSQQGGDNSSMQPPEMPNGDSSSDSGSQPPEKPEGDSSSDNANGRPPQMPNGDSNGSGSNSQPPEMPNGGNSSNSNMQPPEMQGKKGSGKTLYIAITAALILAAAAILLYLIMSGFNKKGFKETLKGWKRIVIYLLSTIIVATSVTAIETNLLCKNAPSANHGEMMQGGPGGMGGNSSESTEASGATTVDGSEETLSENYSSASADESAILVTNGGNATVNNSTITKTGDSTNTESSEFNGVNAAVLVQSGSSANITGADIKTDAKGANAVFATGENAKIYIKNSTITSSGESSARGLDATYGGYIEADNVKITTQGGSCATLATDRGEGTVIAKNSTLETNGSGSPVIYSTGNISIDNSTGTANGSQMVVIEGKNSATVTNSKLSASAKGNRNDVDKAGIMIYQSMSGDASEGTGTLNATDSTLEIQADSDYYKNAPMFFVTNTNATINLKNTKLVYGSGILLNAAGTSEWGNEGSNGGTVTLNAENQTLTGNITADKISTVAINLSSSTYEGAINSDNSAKEITLKLDKTSKIKLTGDTYVTSLEDEDESYSNIDFGSYKLYVNGTAIN